MSEELNNQTPLPKEKEYSEAMLFEAIERLKARGDSVKRFVVMALPIPVFNDLCARLVEARYTVKATAEWLHDECVDRDITPPSRSSVERFSDVLYEEYRLVKLNRSRERAATYVKALTAGDEDAQVMAMNSRLTELVTDSLMDADSIEDMGDDRLDVITKAARAVAAVKFGKKMLDARVDALRKQIEERDSRIQLIAAELLIKEQRIKETQQKIEVAAKALSTKIEKRQVITPEDIAEVRKAVFG